MFSVRQLLNLQSIVGQNMQRIIANFKTNFAVRRNKTCCFEKRYCIFSDEWGEFKKTDGLSWVLVEHPFSVNYLKNQYYEQAQSLAEEYMDIFRTKATRLKGEDIVEDLINLHWFYNKSHWQQLHKRFSIKNMHQIITQNQWTVLHMYSYGKCKCGNSKCKYI